MPQPTERQKQQMQNILATQVPEMPAANNMVKYEELKQTEMPKQTVVVKKTPPKKQEDPESDFVKSLL